MKPWEFYIWDDLPDMWGSLTVEAKTEEEARTKCLGYLTRMVTRGYTQLNMDKLRMELNGQ